MGEAPNRLGIAVGVPVAICVVLTLVALNLPGRVPAPAAVAAAGDVAGVVEDPFAAGDGTVDRIGSTPTLATGGPAAPVPGGPAGTVAPPSGTAAPGAPGAAPGAGPTSDGSVDAPAAAAASTAGCRADGRQDGISGYMPPCASWAGGDNGGATARGVSADSVLVVHWTPQSDPGTEAILSGAGLADTAATVQRAQDALFRYWNDHVETYGRTVELVHIDASGPSSSEEAMRADALRIAEEIRPFAVVDATGGMPLILTRELAQRGVVCICTNSRTSQTYTEVPPLIFNDYPTADEYAAHAAEYIGKKLEGGRTAVHAGDDQTVGQTFRTQQRRYGIVYLNGTQGTVDPDRVRAKDVMLRELGKWGIGPDRIETIGYIYDPGRNQADMTNMIAKLKGAGVTTVIPFWDPLTPILLTQEATRQQYYPEWFNIGLGLSDTTTAARLYDQSQWSNAFGITPLWVTWETVENSVGYREFHHGCPECSPGDEGNLINIYREPIENLFYGIHLAGPRLTNESFVRGMWSYPPTGGTAAMPLQYYTREFPGEIKDFAEFWYDVDASGPDERGEQGRGVIWKAANGARYQLGQWTTEESLAFVPRDVLAVSDDPPGPTDHDHEADGHTHG